MAENTAHTKTTYHVVDADGDERMNGTYETEQEAWNDYEVLLRRGLSAAELPLRVVRRDSVESTLAPTLRVTVNLNDLEELLDFHKRYSSSSSRERELRQRCHIAISYAKKGN